MILEPSPSKEPPVVPVVPETSPEGRPKPCCSGSKSGVIRVIGYNPSDPFIGHL